MVRCGLILETEGLGSCLWSCIGATVKLGELVTSSLRAAVVMTGSYYSLKADLELRAPLAFGLQAESSRVARRSAVLVGWVVGGGVEQPILEDLKPTRNPALGCWYQV